MTEALIEHGMPKKVLEIGTGSGYQGAVLATLGMEVYTVERIDELLRMARRRFRNMGLNLRTKHDDGRLGWPEHAPYDAINVAAAIDGPPPRPLLDQLADGGRLVAPLRDGDERLAVLRRRGDALERSDHGSVRFVPLLRHSDR